MSVPPELQRLVGALASPEASALIAGRSATGTHRRAAVLALFWSDAAGALRLVAIEKTAHLRQHAGQVAFPGGRIEPGETPERAALREASEEVGIEASDVDVLGELPPVSVMASGFDVHTIVGWWRRPVDLLAVDVGEIADVHQLVVSELVRPENRATWVHPSGHSGPVFLIGDLFIWGLTGHLISGLLELGGFAESWDAARRLEIPERFLRGRH